MKIKTPINNRLDIYTAGQRSKAQLLLWRVNLGIRARGYWGVHTTGRRETVEEVAKIPSLARFSSLVR